MAIRQIRSGKSMNATKVPGREHECGNAATSDAGPLTGAFVDRRCRLRSTRETACLHLDQSRLRAERLGKLGLAQTWDAENHDGLLNLTLADAFRSTLPPHQGSGLDRSSTTSLVSGCRNRRLR